MYNERGGAQKKTSSQSATVSREPMATGLIRGRESGAQFVSRNNQSVSLLCAELWGYAKSLKIV